MVELIRKTDSLDKGRVKLNNAIIDAEDAKNISEDANEKATQALANSEDTQTQLDTIVIEGDSSVEAAQARVDADGHVYDILKERLDTEQEDVRQFKEDFDTLIARIGNNEDLNTTQKATLILAINEVNSKANSNESSINDINDSISQLADMISGLGSDLTAHEGDTALDDVHGLLSGGHVIEESGSNQNGDYVRFSNGWQICYFDVPGAQISEETEFISSGQIYRTRTFDWVFPASFIERAKIATGVQSYARWANGYSNAAGTQANLIQWSSADSTDFYTQTVIAFGRWK